MHPFINTATTAVRKAGRAIMRGYERLDEVKVSQKAQNDLVTDIDHRSEKIIVETLQEAYPDHAFLGEELGAQGKSDHLWVIDPLDGTTNFVHGYPHFCISVALILKGKIEHGLIYDPVRDDLFTASRGSGAFYNGHRMRVKTHHNLSKALIGLSYTKKFLPKRINNTLLEMYDKAGGVRRGGSSALDLAYVAAGKLDGCYQWGMKPWDVAAGILLINEAGGLALEPNGEDMLKTGHIIGCNLKLMPSIEAIVKSHHEG